MERPKNNTTYIDFDFYKDAGNVPIDELAGHLGLKSDGRGKFLCPCHNDTHPSMVISKTGKYANKFHCFACGEGGDALLLTMAVRNHILPSAYWADPNRYKQERMDCAKFIDSLYPGAIKNMRKEEKGDFPIITGKMLQTVGLSPDFFQSEIFVTPFKAASSLPEKMQKKTEVYSLDDPDICKDKVLLLMDKINDYIDEKVDNEYINIIKRFPDLDQKAKNYIRETLAHDAQEYETLYQKLQDFLDCHYPDKPWIAEMER